MNQITKKELEGESTTLRNKIDAKLVNNEK